MVSFYRASCPAKTDLFSEYGYCFHSNFRFSHWQFCFGTCHEFHRKSDEWAPQYSYWISRRRLYTLMQTNFLWLLIQNTFSTHLAMTKVVVFLLLSSSFSANNLQGIFGYMQSFGLISSCRLKDSRKSLSAAGKTGECFVRFRILPFGIYFLAVHFSF